MSASPRLPLLLLLGLLPGCPTGGDDTDGDTDDSGTPLVVVPVTGDITEPTTWTSGNLYRVDVAVAVSAPLTIEAGTIVKLGESVSIDVNDGGSLLAGGGDEPCVFTSVADDIHGGDTNGDGAATSPAPGDWGSLVVHTSGTVIDHCLIAYGGAYTPYTGALSVADDATLNVTDSTFAHNLGGSPADTRAAAFNAGQAGVGTVVSGNLFYGNDLPFVVNGGYDVDDTHTFRADIDGDTLGNTYNGIFWGDRYEVSGDVAWTATDVPFVVGTSALGIPEGASLTIGDGVVVKLGDGQRIEAEGALTATNVSFTSLADDELGGDTNGDGGATTAAPGDWGYLALRSSASSLDGCLVRYAGAAAPYTGAVVVEEDAEPKLRDGVFSHNAGGSFADSRAATLSLASAGPGVVVSGNLFRDNDLPLVVNGGVSLDDTNTFQDNVLDAVVIDSDAHTVPGQTTWELTGASVVLYHLTLSVASGATLTLGDGVVLKSEDGRVDVSGTLSQGDDTWFTSLADDNHGGDTNGDGAATSPQDGDWSGVNLCQGGPCEWADWANILYATWP